MIICKPLCEINLTREAGRTVALTHHELQKHITPGISTKELDLLAEVFISKHNAIPSFKGYNGFRSSICTSVNSEFVQGVPSDKTLKEGDIISTDFGAIYNEYHGNSAWTYPVGSIDNETGKLLKITEESLYKGISEIKPGMRLSNISNAIQTYVEENGFSIIREYVGHGIGQDLHKDPPIPHFGPPDKGPRLKAGMVLCVEPMVNAENCYA